MLNKKLEVGEIVSLGGKEVEIDSLLSKAEYLSGRPFLRASNSEPVAPLLSAAPTPSKFKTPMLVNTVMPQKNSKVPTPRHDPTSENALIMPRPSGKIPTWVMRELLRDHADSV